MRSFIVSLLLASASAFVLPFAPRATVRAVSRIQMGYIEDVAANCLEEGCPVDMVEELITGLKSETKNRVSPHQHHPPTHYILRWRTASARAGKAHSTHSS